MNDRVVALVDMDCFYCQVEERLNPALKGLPMAVVQYNQWKGGGIIAVNYEARDRGVTRHIRGEEAKKQCPEITLVTVPTVREKADLTRYRDAGREVISVLCTFSGTVQRASVDEAYIDLTAEVEKRLDKLSEGVKQESLSNTFVVGYSNEKSNDEEERSVGTSNWLKDIFECDLHDLPTQRLAIGAVIVEEMRQAVYDTTGFRCSAGISHNKILAKLACGLHKPNRQTVLPQDSVEELFKTLPVRKVRSLGGKLGEEVEEQLGCKFMGDLLRYSEKELKDKFEEKTGSWLYNIAKGFDYEPVQSRLISKSIGCCKKFPGRTALSNKKDVEHWVGKLAEEMIERLLEDEAVNKRKAQQMVVAVHVEVNKTDIATSKSLPLSTYNYDRIVLLAMNCLKKISSEDPSTLNWSPVIKYLGLSCGKFTDTGMKTINRFFKAVNNTKTPEPKKPKAVSDVIEGESQTSSHDETGGSPSFFEKIFLKDCDKVGKTLKLNLLPDGQNGDRSANEDDSQSSWTDQSDLIEKIETVQKKETKKGTINEFFSKNIMGQSKIVPNKTSKPKSAKRSISTFFKDENKTTSLEPEEIFPDLNSVDDETLSLFPPSFQKKVLEIKKRRSKEANEEESIKTDINVKAGPSNYIEINNSSNHSTDSVGQDQTNNIVPDIQCDPDTDDMFDDDLPLKEVTFLEEENIPNVEIDEIEDQKICSQCFQSISVYEYEQHSDFHLAVKLQKELNSVPIPSTMPTSVLKGVNKNSPKKVSTNKRKVKTESKTNVNNKKMRGIDTFFKR